MDSSPKSVSKRSTLRFSVLDKEVQYKTDYEDGTAQLVNISTGGCAFRDPTTDLELHNKLLLTVKLKDDQEPLEIQATVIRVLEGSYGLQFTTLSNEKKRSILHYFAREQRLHKMNADTAS